MAETPNIQNIQNELTTQVAAILGKDEDEVAPDTTLESLGFDSIRLVEILIFIEREYGVKLMEAGLTRDDLSTPASLARKIVEVRQTTE